MSKYERIKRTGIPATLIPVLLVVMIIAAAGCVTMAKGGTKKAPAQIPVPEITTEPIPTATVQQSEVYVEPYELWKYRTSGYNMSQWFTWQRDDVSGKKDMVVTVTIYRALFLQNYRWWSVSWGRYFWQLPPDGSKYLVIFPCMYMAGNEQRYDPRMYGMGQDHFYVQYQGRVLTPDTDYVPPHRIKELEETWDLSNTVRTGPYGYYRDNSNGTELATDLGYLRMGRSNAWDGFIIFQVPREAKMEDIKVLGRFDGFGYAWWQLA